MPRLLDLLLALILIIVLSPLFIVLSLLVWIKLGRPIFFTQLRPGYKERPFTIIKYRTMVVADTSCKDQAVKAWETDEQRLTSFGRLLRNLSLDELPELFNVVRGDMSLVGPRPLFMEYLPHYSPEQRRRHDVVPGITGWAQVNGRNGLSWEDKFKLDVWYVDHRSLMLDLKILLKTVLVILTKQGVNSPGQVSGPEPFSISAQASSQNREE